MAPSKNLIYFSVNSTTRKNFLKVTVPTILEFVRKIVICGSSHNSIDRDRNFFRKMNHRFLTPNSR
ncbi:hypothetical protein FF021_18690 [Leptospira noguchii]|nr:hypothetical protein FF021_18690 [Leptospira noguchii]